METSKKTSLLNSFMTLKISVSNSELLLMKMVVLGTNLGVSQTSKLKLPYINTETKSGHGLAKLIVTFLVLLVTETEIMNVIPVDQVPSCPV